MKRLLLLAALAVSASGLSGCGTLRECGCCRWLCGDRCDNVCASPVCCDPCMTCDPCATASPCDQCASCGTCQQGVPCNNCTSCGNGGVPYMVPQGVFQQGVIQQGVIPQGVIPRTFAPNAVVEPTPGPN